MRFVLALLALSIGSLASAADPLSVRVRPDLPPAIRTVGEAASYYAETIGYKFYARTPAAGDMRHLAAKPAPTIRSNSAPVTLDTALLQLVPLNVDVYVDHGAHAIAFGPRGGTP